MSRDSGRSTGSSPGTVADALGRHRATSCQRRTTARLRRFEAAAIPTHDRALLAEQARNRPAPRRLRRPMFESSRWRSTDPGSGNVMKPNPAALSRAQPPSTSAAFPQQYRARGRPQPTTADASPSHAVPTLLCASTRSSAIRAGLRSTQPRQQRRGRAAAPVPYASTIHSRRESDEPLEGPGVQPPSCEEARRREAYELADFADVVAPERVIRARRKVQRDELVRCRDSGGPCAMSSMPSLAGKLMAAARIWAVRRPRARRNRIRALRATDTTHERPNHSTDTVRPSARVQCLRRYDARIAPCALLSARARRMRSLRSHRASNNSRDRTRGRRRDHRHGLGVRRSLIQCEWPLNTSSHSSSPMPA
jgi:hypothetical protein